MRHQIHTASRSSKWSAAKRVGATTVEFAVVAPFIFFLIFSAVEFARMMMIQQTLTNAAREGCRHAALFTTRDHTETDSMARARLRSVIRNYDDPEIVRITVTPAFTSSPAPETEIVTLVEVDCDDVSWFPATIFAGATLRGSCSMKRE